MTCWYLAQCFYGVYFLLLGQLELQCLMSRILLLCSPASTLTIWDISLSEKVQSFFRYMLFYKIIQMM